MQLEIKPIKIEAPPHLLQFVISVWREDLTTLVVAIEDTSFSSFEDTTFAICHFNGERIPTTIVMTMRIPTVVVIEELCE